MWDRIATFILRQRTVFLIILSVFTAVMGWMATKVELAYDMQKLVPKDDAEYQAYMDFKKTFGEDGNKLVVGFKTNQLFKLNFYSKFHELNAKLAAMPGVIDVVSPARVYQLELDTSDMLTVHKLGSELPQNQEALDSIAEIFGGLKFYGGLLYNPRTNVALMIVSLKDSVLNSQNRISLIEGIHSECEQFGESQHLEMHYSGLPFIRNEFSTTVKNEITLFTIIAFAVTAVLILLFFRSMTTLGISLLFIAIGVVVFLGVCGILGFKLTLLTGILPTLLVVIGVQNTIYLINKYHEEYRRHGQKAKALARVISRIGVAAFLINFTTAVGFGTFYFTKTTMLEQFGLVSFITINAIFFISIIGVPVLYSYLPVPTDKQTQHLDNKNIGNFLEWVRFQAFNHKRRIYFWSIVITAFGSIYITKLKPLAFMVDDIPKSSKLYQDLLFFQSNFKGVMPFEIIITCHEEGAAKDISTLTKVSRLQKALRRFNDLSKPVSIVEYLSFANQAVNFGDTDYYRLPGPVAMGDVVSKIPESTPGKKSLVTGMVDAGYTKIRVSYQMRDIGSIRMDSLVGEVKEVVKDIFPRGEYDVKITGTSAIFLKGNAYLYDSLLSSTLWALLIISLTMGFLFPSFKMIIISIIPNMIPLLVTGGIMGYLGVPLKPSTILVFSIAFGITVDATIHFVTTFRRELLHGNKSLREALSATIMEVGLSMIYTMVALFAGFMIFIFSRFQGTQALGWLTAVTLLSGLLANLFLLPALILTFEKSLNPKEELKEAVIDLPEDEEDD